MSKKIFQKAIIDLFEDEKDRRKHFLNFLEFLLPYFILKPYITVSSYNTMREGDKNALFDISKLVSQSS